MTPQFVKDAYLKAADMVANDEAHLGYLPPLGYEEFGVECAKLILGDQSK